MFGCIGKTAWEGELVHGTVERPTDTLPKQWWQEYIRTYVRSSDANSIQYTCMQWRCRAREHTHTPSGGRSFNIFLPSFCIFGRPSVWSIAILQYILKAATSALRIKWSNKISFAFAWLEFSIFGMRSSVITFLRFSQSRFSLASTTLKNSSSCFSRTWDAAWIGEDHVQHLNDAKHQSEH